MLLTNHPRLINLKVAYGNPEIRGGFHKILSNF
jgi:hypothetical protein